jgi:class 3 adenylate cyclase
VIFLDIVGFTTLSEQLSSAEVVLLLESVFTALDNVCKKHDVVKIKTIGDSYMAVAFPQGSSSSEQRAANTVPHSVRNDNAHVFSSASAALDMLHAVSHIVSPTGSPVEVRLGVHCGAVTAGVIGKERLQYDVWGDTVNVASRMESSGEPGRIHVSKAFADALNTSPPSPLSSVRGGTSSRFPVPCSLRERGAIEIKGKGLMKTYWLESTSA